MEKYIIFALVIAFAVTAVAVRLLIPVLTKMKLGQRILDIGPSWHMSKSGTPTMGGLAFIIAVLTVLAVFLPLLGGEQARMLGVTALYAVLNGVIGMIDDGVKMKRKQNEGLSAFSKFLLQAVAAALFITVMRNFGMLESELYIPFWGKTVGLGRLYYPFAIVFLTGFVNAVNLTDGLDGLCSSVTAAVALFLTVTAISVNGNALAVLSLAVLGICLAFLIFNFHPAKIFMGDTGSLFLGGAVSAIALVSGKSTLLFIVGGVYLLEAVSVILQVLYYKATKKRLFLMAPIHHHFEKKGMGEVKITLMLTLATLGLAAVALIFA